MSCHMCTTQQCLHMRLHRPERLSDLEDVICDAPSLSLPRNPFEFEQSAGVLKYRCIVQVCHILCNHSSLDLLKEEKYELSYNFLLDVL